MLATRWIIAKLRNRRFFSLTDLNDAIRDGVTALNERVTRHLGTSRRDLFERIERPALRALPAQHYEYAEWRLTRVGFDYHVEVADFFYSVPHTLIRAEVHVRVTARTVEVFHRGQRIAAHERRYGGRRHGTDPDHMPSSHRRYAEWTPDRFRRWARTIGPNTEALIIAVLTHRPHPEQGFRTCLGILRLYRGIEPMRAEAISARAIEIGAMNYRSVASILTNNLDRVASRQSRDEPTLFDHPNVRGPRYFN